MAADAAAANYNHERVAELFEALRREEDPVSGELLEDELIIEVTGLRASSEGLSAKVFFVGGGNRSEACQLSRRGGLLAISNYVSY